MLTKILDKRYHPAILITLWVIMHSLLFAHYGIRNLVDANSYVDEAKYIVRHGTLDDIRHLYYFIPIGIMAIFELLFPNQILPFLFFQILLNGLACWSLYKGSENIFNTPLAGIFSVMIFLLWWDMIHWNVTTMTESIAASSICFTIHFLSRFKSQFCEQWMLFVIMIGLFFIRPTGIVTLVSIIGFLLSYSWNTISPKIKTGIVTGLLLFAIIVSHQMFLQWDFTEQYRNGSIVTYMDRIEGQPLYHKSLRMVPEDLKLLRSRDYPILTIISFPVLNPIYFLKTASLKLWYLISFTRPYYTSLHNAYSLVWMSFIYLFFVSGLKHCNNMPIKIFVLTSVIVNCALIAISTVDWDNRFYIPMEPGIALMAGGGLAFLFNRNK